MREWWADGRTNLGVEARDLGFELGAAVAVALEFGVVVFAQRVVQSVPLLVDATFVIVTKPAIIATSNQEVRKVGRAEHCAEGLLLGTFGRHG